MVPMLSSFCSGCLEGHMLIAIPTISDPYFKRSLIYICAHTKDGAMGIMVNKTAQHISFSDLFDKSELESKESEKISLLGNIGSSPVHIGGPVDHGRGFVLHSPDYREENATIVVDSYIHLTATMSVLKTIASGRGPEQFLVAMGYAGWASGQLESELYANHWLQCKADPKILFMPETDRKYEIALANIGVDPLYLVSTTGHC